MHKCIWAFYMRNVLYCNLVVFQAANYLDIKGLLDVTCKTVANMIKGKSPEEIRKTFNIKNDFTPAEEEQVYCLHPAFLFSDVFQGTSLSDFCFC